MAPNLPTLPLTEWVDQAAVRERRPSIMLSSRLLPPLPALASEPQLFTKLPTVAPQLIKSAPGPPAIPQQHPRRAKSRGYCLPEEDPLPIKLQNRGKKRADIGKRVSPTHNVDGPRCQKYLDSSQWDEEKRNKLAQLYEKGVIVKPFPPCSRLRERRRRCLSLVFNLEGSDPKLTVTSRYKAKTWLKVAYEMEILWRLVEAMHWYLGQQEMTMRDCRATSSLPIAPISSYLCPATNHEVPCSPSFRASSVQGDIPISQTRLPSFSDFMESLSEDTVPAPPTPCNVNGARSYCDTSMPRPGLMGLQMRIPK